MFVPGEGGARFEALPPATQAEVERLLRVVGHRVLRLLERRGALPAQGPEDAQKAYQAHSLQQRLFWTEVDVRLPPRKQPRCALLEGFSLKANTLLNANDRQGLERLCRYGRAARWRWSVCRVTDGWAPDQNPSVNSGPDRGHSHATDWIIQPGDFIQTDFGIAVQGRWVTDIQRFAYMLAPGETKAPPEALEKWERAKKGNRVALAALKPGARGWDVDKAQRDWMREAGSEPVMWGTGHPVGYWAHDVGPALSGAQKGLPAKGASARLIRPGQVFAFDGFFAWKLPTPGETKTISVEEMAVVTEAGAEYLIPPQEEIILIPSPR